MRQCRYPLLRVVLLEGPKNTESVMGKCSRCGEIVHARTTCRKPLNAGA